MGFRFRKSIKAGPFRINFSKSGIGYSVGGKGFRYTKKAGGGTRTTWSIPGTGISYVKEAGQKSTQTKRVQQNPTPKPPISSKKEGISMEQPKPKNTNTYCQHCYRMIEPGTDVCPQCGKPQHEKPKCKVGEFILCLLLGWAGAHKFYNKRYGLGVIYLLTFGIFSIGWLGDTLKMVFTRFSKDPDTPPRGFKAAIPYLIIACILSIGALAPSQENTPDPTTPTEIVTEALLTTEPTEVTEAATDTPTEQPTDAPTEAPTEPPATEPPTEAPTTAPVVNAEEHTYLLNTSSKKFHHTYCSRGPTKESNKKYFTGTRDEVIAMGYEPCQVCNP